MAEETPEETPEETIDQPTPGDRIETLSSATPSSQSVPIPGDTVPTGGTKKTMRNMILAVLLTAAIIIGFLIFMKYSARGGSKSTTPVPPTSAPQVEPTVAESEAEVVQGITIEEPDFTDIEADVNGI